MSDPVDTKPAGRVKSRTNRKSAGKTPTSVTLAGAKRTKTGGRRRVSIEDALARARIASEIAALHDDTTLPAYLAAIYLGISLSHLESLRALPDELGTSRGFEGPPMIKIIERGAVGQNQPVFYKLGALRAYQAKYTSTTSFGSALNSGLLGWMTHSNPFFARQEARRVVILGNAWNILDPRRDELFMEVAHETIELRWLTPREAVLYNWDDMPRHKAFADIGLALLRKEIRGFNAAIQDTGDYKPPAAAW